MSHLLRSEILGLFDNTLTTEDMYSCRYRESFIERNETQLCKKQNVFSQFFIVVLKSTKIFKLFDKTNEPHRLSILDVTVSERCSYLNV